MVLKRILFICALLTSPLEASETYPAYFKYADPPGSIGETGHLSLIEGGFYARPLYNDIFGKTDKHLSGETQLGWMFEGLDQSLALNYSWRFITPEDTDGYGQPREKPVGRYADWMELQFAYARVSERFFNRPIRFLYTLGFGHIGDKGARDVHHEIHRVFDSSLEGLEYSDQPQGPDLSRGFELGLFSPSAPESLIPDLVYSLGVFANKFMNELYMKSNYVGEVSENFSWAAEGKLVRQLKSEAYSDPTTWRYEFSAGVRWKWYRPSIKYVSHFLQSDKVSQIYLDPLAIHFAY